MFVSPDKNAGKKTFQKPNILRRRPKVATPRPITPTVNESPGTRSLVTTHVVEAKKSVCLDKLTKLEESKKLANVKQTVWKLTLSNSCDDKEVSKSQETDTDINMVANCSNSIVTKSVDKTLHSSSLNIEAFINADSVEQDMPLSVPVATILPEKKINQAKSKWCFDLSNNSMDIIINSCSQSQSEDTEHKLDFIVPSTLTSDLNQKSKQIQEQVSSGATPPQTTSVNHFSSRAIRFKCDYPNCNKGFWSEEKLTKHKINKHIRQTARTQAQTNIECPVKKTTDDGTEERCPRTFQMRVDLLKHLNEDHTLEDAQYRCGVCGRRFFWASGLRAHGASVCAREGLACGWPGCGRVFRLPCRLREHARAHTGDRPYRCRFPECGWAFRSASKLVRHARRHTDERRHACGACGRAFLRREHLRDHLARHHHPAKRTPHPCTHPGCEQTFTNMSTLYMHMKKVHRKAQQESVAPVAAEQMAAPREVGENVYFVSLVEESPPVEEETSAAPCEEGLADGLAEGGPWHAARTHCTWPLPRHHAQQHVLDDEAQAERAEGSGSDVYTIRSDLFLHGNVPIDEDSQHIGGSGETSGGAALDADLCLIDAHPTIDLMQEELMYEDPAVDESSFRVFLMNGDELT